MQRAIVARKQGIFPASATVSQEVCKSIANNSLPHNFESFFDARFNCTSSSGFLLRAHAQEKEREGREVEMNGISTNLEASSLAIASNSTSCICSSESVSQCCGNDRYRYRPARGGALIMDLCTMRVPPHRTHDECKYIPESHCHSISRYWGVCTISV